MTIVIIIYRQSVRSVPKGGKCFGERNCKEETAEMLKILKTSLWRMNVHHLVLESKLVTVICTLYFDLAL